MFELDDKEKLAKTLEGLIGRMRDRREPILKKWLETHSAWKGQSSKTFFKSATFAHYIPYFRRSIERFVRRAAQMCLPSTEYFEVIPADESDDEAGKKAESVHNWLLYLMRKRIKIYSIAKQLFRTFALYGIAVAKTSVQVYNRQVFPTVRAVDPFLFMFWPETVSNVDEARIVVEDSFIPYEQYEAMAERVKADPIDPKDLQTPIWPAHLTQRLNTSGLTEPSTMPSGEANNEKPSTWVFMSECYLNQGKNWRKVWIVWNLKRPTAFKEGEKYAKIVLVGTKTYDRPQYRVSVDRQIPGEQESTSMGEDQESLQTLLNDQINMLSEGQALGLAPPTAVDPNLVTRSDSLVFGIRRKWAVPPDAVKPLLGFDTTKVGYQAVHFTMGLMDLFSGSHGLGEGEPVRNMPRAGFAVSSLMSMSLTDIRDAARAMEDDIFTPLLRDLHEITVEFMPEKQTIKVPGTDGYPRTYTKEDLEGDYDMTWVGSLQSQENEQRSEKLMKIVSIFGTGSGELIMADMARRGKQVNWTELFKRVWRDGVGERGADSIIEDIEKKQDEVAESDESQQIIQMIQQLGGGGNGGLPA